MKATEAYPPTELDTHIRFLEELSLNALPALRTSLYDGWVLRFSDGYTRRANSISPLYDSRLDLATKITAAERFYAAYRQPTVFKLTPLPEAQRLDTLLAREGYRRDQGASVQTLALDGLEPPGEANVEFLEQVDEGWLETFFRLYPSQPSYRPVLRQMLAAIVHPVCCATLRLNGQAVALGLGVIERGWIGLFNIVTDAAFRNQGWGSQLVLNLLDWGKRRGATNAYLQVHPANAPALRLYDKLGFSEVYQYWYRERW
jgi:ribosomal protein S18 acetylase RimI-like enzyme